MINAVAWRVPALRSNNNYRGGNKGLCVLLSRTQAEPGRTVKQEQEEISRNHVQTPSVQFGLVWIPGGRGWSGVISPIPISNLTRYYVPYTGIGKKVGSMLRESRLLAPSGRGGGASSRNLGHTF